MKKILLVTLICLVSLQLQAQTDGISYQAVIVGPNDQELPGMDAQGNILPNASVAIKFTIINANNSTEYQEIQTTNTDQYGRINLIIGSVDPDGFALISWDGTAKNLKVEIDFSGRGNNYVDMSRQELTFVPYAYHRNITARGTLKVDDVTNLNSELFVDGPTNLNSTLNVNNGNATNLSGLLNVEGVTDLKNNLSVDGITNLNNSLNVNNQTATNLSGNLTVEGSATIKGPSSFNILDVKNNLSVNKDNENSGTLDVNGTTLLKGQTTINANMDTNGGEDKYKAYPLLVEGSQQGIAIKVTGNRGIANNYISFWDTSTKDGKTPTMWGRIEGQSLGNLWTDPEYLLETGGKSFDIVLNAADLGIAIAQVFQKSVVKLSAAGTSSTACIGFGACVTAPIPSLIVEATADSFLNIANAVVVAGNLGLAIGEEVAFIAFKNANIGVSYQSGAGDYAEWLPKQNPLESFTPGEVVGIKNGLVTKNIWDVEKIMIVSTNPIVLGNMPQPNNEKNYIKVAFMGQVPVRVFGKVMPGDYILPSELGNGFGKAVHPKDMNTKDYKKIAGVAWNIIEEFTQGISLVNVAVGINTNELSGEVAKLEEDLKVLQSTYDQLKIQIKQSNSALVNLVPGYAKAIGLKETKNSLTVHSKNEEQQLIHDEDEIIQHNEDGILFFELSDEQLDVAIEMAKELYTNMLNNQEQINKLISNNSLQKDESKEKQVLPSKKDNNIENLNLPSIKDHPFWKRMSSDPAYAEEIKTFIKSNAKKGIHTHKKYAHKFTDLKISKN